MTTAPSSAWTSSFRARSGRDASDSDSDSDPGCISDVGAGAVAKVTTNEAQLIREMDLSGRHETVEYRPNPWSIARINAASRPPPPAFTRTPGPDRPPPKPIVDAFKRQAKRGPRGDAPLVRTRDITNLGNDSIGASAGVDEPCATKYGALSAKKPRQGCESNQDTALAGVHVRPQYTGLLVSPSACKPQIHAVEALEGVKSTHTSTFSDHVVQSARTPPPFKYRRIFDTHRVARSSPVAPRSAPDVGYTVDVAGDQPVSHRSSPGPRSHIPASAQPLCTNTKISHRLPSVPALGRFLGNAGKGTVPGWLLGALGEEIHVSPSPPLPLVPKPRQDATDPPHIRTPEPKRKRLTLPEPPRRKPRASASRPPDPAPDTTSASQRCPTAYAFGEDDDPDAEWSTLARRATTSTRRVKKSSGVRQSGSFRLPLPGLALGTPTRAPEVKRRVITYLPPPMASKKLLGDVDGGPRASMNRRAEAITAEIDPPQKGPAKYAQMEIEEQELEEEVAICVMDSDVTLVNEDEEDVAKIDVDDICVHYPATRASMKAESRIRKVVGCIVELRA